VVILLVCSDEERLTQRRNALKAAGFLVVSARTVEEAWSKAVGFDIWAVVLDYEHRDDESAKRFGDRFFTLNLNQNAPPEQMVMELADLLGKSSNSIQ